MPERVDALPIRAPRSGLALLVAAPAITGGDDRWLDGFTWQPELTAAGSTSGVSACGTIDERDPGDQPDPEVFDPFLVWVAEKCSTKGWRTRDWAGRARRALEAEQSFLAAAELWGASASAGDNPSLTAYGAETLTTSAVPAAVALTWIDSALTRRLRNRTGMVHARPELVDVWMAADLLRFDQGGYFTPLGHLVVADAGYTGDGPRTTADGDPVAADGSSQWVVGTDLIAYRLGTVEVLPASLEEPGIGEGVDRTRNDLTVWAQRPVGFQWDRHAHLAAEVDQGALA